MISNNARQWCVNPDWTTHQLVDHDGALTDVSVILSMASVKGIIGA